MADTSPCACLRRGFGRQACLFFRQNPYPRKLPHADVAAAEKLIHDCGYHHRDEELADAKQAIMRS